MSAGGAGARAGFLVYPRVREKEASAGGELGGLPCCRVAGVRVAVYRRGKGGERAGGRGVIALCSDCRVLVVRVWGEIRRRAWAGVPERWDEV